MVIIKHISTINHTIKYQFLRSPQNLIPRKNCAMSFELYQFSR